MHIWMHDPCVEIDRDEEVVFMQAFEHAADDYTTLVEPHIASVEATTPRTIDELKQLLREACTEVSHGSQSAAAR